MQVRILQPTKNSGQSGGKKHKWIIEFPQKQGSMFKEQLIGRLSSADVSNELNLEFDTKEEAVAFAENKSYQYEVIEPKIRKILPKTYASNFS